MIFFLLKKLYAAPIPKVINRILVIREAAIGDVLCMTPFLHSLRNAYSHAQIDYVVVDWAKNAIETNPNINRIYNVSNQHILGKSWKVALNRLFFYSALRKNGYDVVFCPSTQLLYKLPLLLFRKSYKIGFGIIPKRLVGKDNFLLDDYVYIDLKEIPRTRHIAIRNLEMLDLLLGTHVSRENKLEIYPTTDDTTAITQIIERLEWQNSEIIAISISAGSAVKSDSLLKTAPKELFVKVIQLLCQSNPNRRIALIGAKSEFDIAASLEIVDEKKVVNLCGKLSLRQSYLLLKRCRLLISNDSGATHLASAAQVPHIVLFGPTDDVEFGPYQNPDATIYRVDLPCAPCRKSTCEVDMQACFASHRRPFCLSMIDAQQVAKIAEDKLSRKQTPLHYFQSIHLHV